MKLRNNLDVIIFYIIVAFIAIWYWHVDEHFQISEFASYKLGYTPLENLAWEFPAHIRTGILPFFCYTISKILLVFHLFNPFLAEGLCRVFAAILFLFSFSRLISLFKEFHNQIEQDLLFEKFSLFFWILPIVMVRFSSESIGSSLFWIGLYYYSILKSSIERKQLILVGILWGLAFHIRIHTAILIGISYIWVILNHRKRIYDLGYLFLGFSVAISFELVSNYWLYNEWHWTPWKYFAVNVLDGKANNFGTMPFYFYGLELLKNLVPPLSIFILLSSAFYIKNNLKSIFVWLFIGFILVHTLIAHKEYRFLFSVFPLIPLMTYMGFSKLAESYKWKMSIFKFFYIFNLLLLPSCFFIQSFRPYNFFKLYPYTITNQKIFYINNNPFIYSNRFPSLMYYFYKNPKCRVVKLNEVEKSNEVNIILSEKNMGDEFKWKNMIYTKQYSTLSPLIQNLLPNFVLSTIDYLYIYQKKE